VSDHVVFHMRSRLVCYTLSEAWSGVNWADLMAAQGTFGTNFYDRCTRTMVGTMLWTEYRPVIKIGPKGALGSHEIRPIHPAPSLGQSIEREPPFYSTYNNRFLSRYSLGLKDMILDDLRQTKLFFRRKISRPVL